MWGNCGTLEWRRNLLRAANARRTCKPCKLLLGRSRIENVVGYPAIDVHDALSIADQLTSEIAGRSDPLCGSRQAKVCLSRARRAVPRRSIGGAASRAFGPCSIGTIRTRGPLPGYPWPKGTLSLARHVADPREVITRYAQDRRPTLVGAPLGSFTLDIDYC
jgi:hypothetical protein